MKTYTLPVLIFLIPFTFIDTTKLLKSEISSSIKMKTTTKHCNPLCAECSTNDLNYCTMCQTGIIFYNFNCYMTCPDGTYLDNEAKDCRACDKNCPVCWGPAMDMCGYTYGLRSVVVPLEEEIKNFLIYYTFTKNEIDIWINNLKTILKGTKDYLQTDQDFENLSSNEVYMNGIDKSSLELPIGSFSKYNGVFIPIPSYIGRSKKLIRSHWVYRKGTWDGQSWVSQYYPRLPTFIRSKGIKNKIYIENGGYWLWQESKGWTWLHPLDQSENYSEFSINEMLSNLNSIKIDLGDYNRKRLKDTIEIKKLKTQNDIKRFFDKLEESNDLIFTEMKHAIIEEQDSFLNSLDDLKSQVHGLFGEELLTVDRSKLSEFMSSKREALSENCNDDQSELMKKATGI